MLRQLMHIKISYADTETIYAGHGDPAGLNHIDLQINYIKFMQNRARKIISDGNYKDIQGFNMEIIDKNATLIMEEYPALTAYGFPALGMTSQNLIGVIKELEMIN